MKRERKAEDCPNLYLLGFMGTGKSSIGRKVAARLGFRFLDSDAEIEKLCGMETKDIFAKFGEAKFRQMEREFIESGHPDHNCVIACGGGIVLRHENMDALKATGLVVFLDRNLEDLCAASLPGRPLINGDVNRVRELYGQRIGLYRRYADLTVDSSAAPPVVAQLLWEALRRAGEV